MELRLRMLLLIIMKNKLLEKWEPIGLILSVFILIFVGLLEVFAKFLITNYPTIISIITGLTSGFIATIVVLYLERKHERKKLSDFYKKYEGCYIRTDIGQDNTSDNSGIRDENVGLYINMTYVGGHEFLLDLEYWKSENAMAKGFIEFNPKDKNTASGYYRYTKGETYTGVYNHYDKIELSWDESKKEMIVIYRHQHPRKFPFTPDSNRGWEIWEKYSKEISK